MTMRHLLPVTALVVVLLAAGCSSDAVEPPGLTASPSVAPTPSATPEPSPAPTDGIQVHSDPEVGIVFEDVPDLTGDEAEVYNWAATYQKALWETLRTNQASSAFAGTSSAEVQDTMARIASNNATSGVRIGGEFHTRISDIAITVDPQSGVATATATVCDDFRRATYTTESGSFTAAEVQQDVPQRNTYELFRLDDGTWYFNRVIGDGTC